MYNSVHMNYIVGSIPMYNLVSQRSFVTYLIRKLVSDDVIIPYLYEDVVRYIQFILKFEVYKWKLWELYIKYLSNDAKIPIFA